MENRSISPFYVGQKVECITNTGWEHEKGYDVDGPVYKEICTVTDVMYIPRQKNWFICLKGYGDREDNSFIYSAFRPVQEQKFPLMTFEKIKEKEQTEILIPN